MIHELEQYLTQEESDPKFKNFVKQMRVAGCIAVQLGQRYEYDSSVKCSATTESRNPTDFYVCEARIQKARNPIDQDVDIKLGRYVPQPDEQRAELSPWKQYASVCLLGDGEVSLYINSHFVPEVAEFEEPTPDLRFPKPGQIVRRCDPVGTWTLRGPITSLGPKTRNFLYSFTDKTMAEILMV